MTCACQLKVVYGFSMMMTGESPRMLFEVIMNRFKNDYSPDIIYDASCKLKEYALNREPKRFMSIRVTSDRFHENNHKTCSSSFKTSSYGVTAPVGLQGFIITNIFVFSVIKGSTASAVIAKLLSMYVFTMTGFASANSAA